MKKALKSSITIVIPAYNEERYLEKTFNDVCTIVESMFKDYEIIIFDDCSADKTGEIADRLARKSSKIKVFHNKKNMGLGYNYRQGVKLAKKEYFVWIAGDDELSSKSMKKMFEHIGEADIIIPYIANKKKRSLLRRIMAGIYINSLNSMFGLHLKQYTGNSIFKTKSINKIKMKTNSFAFQLELLLPLIKRGCSYKEVPTIINRRSETTILRIKNIIGVLATMFRVFFMIRSKKY